jgi:hypothetical protein
MRRRPADLSTKNKKSQEVQLDPPAFISAPKGHKCSFELARAIARIFPRDWKNPNASRLPADPCEFPDRVCSQTAYDLLSSEQPPGVRHEFRGKDR